MARGQANSLRSTDFGQVWFAARCVLAGVDPYSLIGPHLPFNWDWPFVYPITAALVAIPLTPFAESAASVLFVAIGAGCFAWTLMEHGYGPLFGFFALSTREATAAAQWSPLIAASFAIPAVSIALVAKPTVGAALFVARPRWLAVVGGIALTALAFLLQPTWVLHWQHALQVYRLMEPSGSPFRAIVGFPGGVLALACLLRWRRPEARLVAALACVPVTVSAYETVPLLLVPRTFWETALLVALGYAQAQVTMIFVPVPWTTSEFIAVKGQLLVLSMYIPVTIMVLRRPNEGSVPAWLERLSVTLSTWVSGKSGTR